MPITDFNTRARLRQMVGDIGNPPEIADEDMDDDYDEAGSDLNLTAVLLLRRRLGLPANESKQRFRDIQALIERYEWLAGEGVGIGEINLPDFST